MFETGLVSVTFRKLDPVEIIKLVKTAGLSAIEWGSDVHVPQTDLERATTIGGLTRESGIRVASYGSYYRPGVQTPDEFEPYLKAALALGAPVIRVWAGNKGSADASTADRDAVISCTQAICDMAARHNVTICYEYHNGTLTDQIDSAIDAITAINRPNMKLYWQYNPSLSREENGNALRRVLPYLQTVHTFAMDASLTRHPLATAIEDWQAYKAILEESPADHPVLLEFVEGDQPEAFLRDAKTLTELFA